MLTDDEGEEMTMLRIAIYLGKPETDPVMPDEVPPDRVQLYRHERGAMVVDGEPVGIADELQGIIPVGSMVWVAPLRGYRPGPDEPSWHVVSVDCREDSTC